MNTFAKKKKRYGRVAFTTSAKTSLFKELEILQVRCLKAKKYVG